LRIAGAVFGGVNLVWWLAVKLAWLVGILGEREPGVRWLGVGWRAAMVTGGALPTFWIGFAPRGLEQGKTETFRVGWPWSAEPPRFDGDDDHDGDDCERVWGELVPWELVILRPDDRGRARIVCSWTVAERHGRPGDEVEREIVRWLRLELGDVESGAVPVVGEAEGDDGSGGGSRSAGISRQWFHGFGSDAGRMGKAAGALPVLPVGCSWVADGLDGLAIVGSGGIVAEARLVPHAPGLWDWIAVGDFDGWPAGGLVSGRAAAAAKMAEHVSKRIGGES
jgi:hypothetical protein